MEKNLDITNHRYNEPISPVPWHFVKSRFHCIIPVLTGMKLCNGLASSLGEEWGAGFSIGNYPNRWQKFRKRRRINYLQRHEILGGVWGYAPLENLENSGHLECISCILEQELGYLNRTGSTDRC